ncbi:MAG: CbiQ family ECF transporter T component [Pseudanabaenaceae cyanobacterium bins.39]|nr:CbiQ family ECF transporter T component [Pseudanabaenaceae cyanobacterium bins.39]
MDILRSLPIGLYLEQPVTWLHRIDPRIKLIALLTVLLSPIQANDFWRITIFLSLILITLASQIPLRVWKQQMGILLLLAFMTLAIASISPDGLNVNIQPRRPIPTVAQTTTPPSAELSPPLPQPTTYRYILWKAGNITITRKSFDLGLRVCTLIFTYLYAPTLFLLVTAPEEITAAIAALFSPLQILKIPITEIVLTLTLALRFVPLVLEEVQNLARSIRTRSINWKKLGFKRSSQIWMILAERLIDNLFIRAEQTASAMQVRGFTSPNTHLVKWNQLTMSLPDFLILFGICLLWGVRIWFGNDA